jgi:hypothetical protein
MNMKSNQKFRNIINDDNGAIISLEISIWTAIMIMATAVITPTVMVITMKVKDTGETTANALAVSAGLMRNVTDYMRQFNFRPNGNNTTTPFVEYQFNSTTKTWDFWYCESHSQQWIHLGSAPTTRYTLTVSVIGKGTVATFPSQTSYLAGSYVVVNATPKIGMVFSRWSGDVTNTTNPLILEMNTNKTICATFTNPLE